MKWRGAFVARIVLGTATPARGDVLFGTPIGRGRDAVPGKAIGPTTLRDPRTLEPLPSAEPLPDTGAYELAPDGSAVAVLSRKLLRFYAMDTGRLTGTLPVKAEAMFWAGEGLVALENLPRAPGASAVDVVDPATATITSRTVVPAPSSSRWRGSMTRSSSTSSTLLGVSSVRARGSWFSTRPGPFVSTSGWATSRPTRSTAT